MYGNKLVVYAKDVITGAVELMRYCIKEGIINSVLKKVSVVKDFNAETKNTL